MKWGSPASVSGSSSIMEDMLMLIAVVFEEFAFVCQFFNDDTKVGYGCNHPS